MRIEVEIVRGFLLGGLSRGEGGEEDEDQVTAQGLQAHGHSFQNQEWNCNSWVGWCANSENSKSPPFDFVRDGFLAKDARNGHPQCIPGRIRPGAVRQFVHALCYIVFLMPQGLE